MTANEYIVKAKRWEHGWELDIEGVGITQSRTLDDAESMARDYLAMTVDEEAAKTAAITIRPVVAGVVVDVTAIREMQAKAEQLQAQAAAAFRQVAADLRAAGVPGSDIARAIGVSAQRVSQLLAPAVSSAKKSASTVKVAPAKHSGRIERVERAVRAARKVTAKESAHSR